MFKENRFIFYEILPNFDKPSKGPRRNFEHGRELPKEVKEKEEKEKEDSEKVAEKIMDELELYGIKCPKCGLKNVKENLDIKKRDPKKFYLKCSDCDYEWEEENK